MNHKITLALVGTTILASSIAGCSGSANGDTTKPGDDTAIVNITHDFNNLDAWEYYHQDTASIEQWKIEEGILYLTTRANTYDRSKMHTTDHTYADGTYRWRTYIPAIEPGEQVSVGSWIYHDDHHELDFEVGSGSAAIRAEHNLTDGQLLACMTNQDNPFYSGYTPINPGWHDFELKLDVAADGNYLAIWSIDGEEKQRLQLQFGPEIGFSLQCSVENLKFIGDTIASANHTAMFDYVSFSGHKLSEQ